MGAAFSPDYFTARTHFREAAARLGWEHEVHPIDARGPGGEQLTIDVASSTTGDWRNVLVVSSGVHGVEGFFGSAVQLALFERWATIPPPIKVVFLHGLNPFGFAWLRRFDESNVDPNRNFLLPGERFEGANEHYARLDRFLNLQRSPRRWDMFVLQAAPLIAKYGVSALTQAIAEGQYSFPRGLFYGGAAPSQMQQILRENMPRWLTGSRSVVHLDFHTGLGRNGECRLLIDYPLNDRQRRSLANWFGEDSFEAADPKGISYKARGGFGRWCVSRSFAAEYLFAFAEFGTYKPIRVLAGMRAENQAHHWGDPSAASTRRAKQRLSELFCPADAAWRSRVIEKSLDLVDRALNGLQS